jgi:LPS-assembly lipoprotein
MVNFRSLVVLALGLLLAGCGYRPLYGTTADGRGVADSLSAITVQETGTRIGQQIRNSLLSSIRPAGSGRADAYRLVLTPDVASVLIADQGRPGIERRRVRLNVTYQLYDIASGQVVNSGKTFSVASFDAVHEPVADLQAESNATSRAVQEAAGDIRTRLAAFMSKRQG